jgi:predicted metal-dependent hydrolase
MMEQQKNFPYQLRRNKRSTSISLRVYQDGRVVVAAPMRVSLRAIRSLVTKQYAWIENKLREYAKEYVSYMPHMLRRNRKEYIEYKETARTLVHARLEHFNTYYRLSYNRVSIKETRSRWGSCSKKGNLNFSYKLALIPQELADYVIVHELCHIQELNHSKNFWQLVEKTIPNYKELREKLKRV